MREDRTGWEIVWDGTDRGLMGRELLPPRPTKPSDLWNTVSRRLYRRSGRYTRLKEIEEIVEVRLEEDEP